MGPGDVGQIGVVPIVEVIGRMSRKSFAGRLFDAIGRAPPQAHCATAKVRLRRGLPGLT